MIGRSLYSFSFGGNVSVIFALPREKNGFIFLIIVRLLRTLALHWYGELVSSSELINLISHLKKI